MSFFGAGLVSYCDVTDDGRFVFQPWGLRAGYLLPSRDAYRRVRKQLGMFDVAFLLAVVAGVLTFGGAGLAVMLVGWLIVYFVWALRVCAPLERTRSLSLAEVHRHKARRSSTLELWILELVGLAFVVPCVVFFAANPLVATAGILFFGFGSVVFAVTLGMRHRGRV